MTLLACSTVDITPPPGHPLGGYVARGDAPALGTADPLEATLFWLSTDDDPGVCWLSLDALAVDTVLARKLAEVVGRAIGIPGERVLVCASHTHSAPIGWTGSIHPAIPGERDQSLAERLVDTISQAAARLPEQRLDVELTWSVASVNGLGANRNHVDGPHDTTAGVVIARSRSKETVALLVDYACHPTVLGPGSHVWSADWPGAARRSLASALASDPVITFLQGAAGDCSPRFVRQGRDHAEVTRLGALLSDAVLRADARTLDPTPPRTVKRTVRVPMRQVPGVEAGRRLVSAAYERLTGQLDTPEERLTTTQLEGARALSALGAAELPTHLDLPLTVVALGDIAWVHLPVELFASFGLRIKQSSPFPMTRVIGYTDGYAGYVSDAEGYREGCTEALLSFLDEGAGELFVTESLALLEQARYGR